MNAQRLLGIESGRGVAALMVVFYHAARHLKADIGYLPWGGFARFGHAGVDFFFVLSGFIILFVHRRDLGTPAALPRYAERRFLRIYPLFWFSVLVGLGLALLSSRTNAVDLGLTLRSLSLLPIHGEVGVAWTLQHELLFYLIFALGIVYLRLGMLVAALWLASIVAAWAGWLHADGVALVERLSAIDNIGFFFGMAAAWVVQALGASRGRLYFAAGCAAFLLSAGAEMGGLLDGYGPLARLAYGTASTLIVIGIALENRSGHLQPPRALVALGTASYAVYLMHLPCIGIVYKLMGVTGLLHALPAQCTYAVLVASGVAGGMIISRLVEYPAMQLARGWLHPVAAAGKRAG